MGSEIISDETLLEEERKALGLKKGKSTLGIALSGGGIRSASFALGVLKALNDQQVLDKAHYLSTVSGGGYAGSAFTWYRNNHPDDKKFTGLCTNLRPK